MPGWKFVTNYALVLCQIAQQPRITMREISLAIGITEKATHRIITDLETEGYITKIREGRRLRYRINPDLCLRDEMLQDKAVGDLLEVLGWKRRRGQIQRRELVTLGEKAEP
ncbi:MAG TPA: winged helix-turn-helix transcriptional regulator [Dehalococcoidia bacterium]|nr:winged helix-turn-helix transcriptional regulator [Dehalococcoidia bacterium]